MLLLLAKFFEKIERLRFEGFDDTPMIPPVKHLDRSKMIQTEDVAQAVLWVLNAPATSCPVEITIRPERTPYR